MNFTYTENFNDDGQLISVIRSDGWQIPANPANSDYQAYLAWLEDPNAEITPPVL
jgi:hypothetical protein